jgi:hypothetical protein
MTGQPDPTKVYVALDSFVTELDGKDLVIHKGDTRMGDDPTVVRAPNLWLEADKDPATIAYKRLLAEALQEAEKPQASRASSRGLTREDIQGTFRRLQAESDRRPSRLDVAGALHTSEATVKRAQEDLGISGWPPV